jgi:hypothetical protein
MDQSDEIIRQLATLTEQVTGIRRDLERQDQSAAEDREDSQNSRREMHETVNAMAVDVATVKGDVKVAGVVAAQARDGVAALKQTVEAAAPTIADMQTAKSLGLWLLGGGGVAAFGVGLAALSFGEQVKAWLSHWLGVK